MALINWTDQLAVGVKDIDTQHKMLVDLINSLHTHMVAGDANDLMGKVLDKIIEYTGFHFATEERLMAAHGYPQSPAHKHEHAKLVQTAVELQKKVKSGQAHVTMETMNFLRDWLQHHIKESDKAFGAYLSAKGVH